MTNQMAGTKQCDSRKLLQVRFKNRFSAMVARAGAIEGADIFHEIFETLAATTEVTGWRTIADTAEAALKQARAKILSNFQEPAFTSDQIQEHLASLYHELVLAYFYRGKPYIFKADSTGATTIKVSHPFVALGSGRNVASFILEGFDTLSLDEDESVGLAAYVIEMCKRTDLYCAGPVQIGIMTRTNGAQLFDPSFSRILQEAVEDTHKRAQLNLAKEVKQTFGKLYEPIAKAKMKALDDFLNSKIGDAANGKSGK